MFHHCILLAVFAYLEVVHSLFFQERIEPVLLHYQCLHPANEDYSKNPILLLHGLGSSLRSWEGLDRALAIRTRRRVCAVDLRNHGDSPWNNRTDVAALATDISYFLDMHNIKRVSLIGHSLGGKTAVHYTLNNPHRVESIVIEDMRPNGITAEALTRVQFFLQSLMAAIETVPVGVNKDEALRIIMQFFNKRLEEAGSMMRYDESYAKFIEIRSVKGKWQAKWNIKLLSEAIMNIDRFLTESFGLYSGSALFIYGTESPFAIGEDKENILRLFPKARLYPVKGADHVIHPENSEFEDVVVKFLNGVKECFWSIFFKYC